MRNQEGKIDLQKNIHRRIRVRDITFLTERPPFHIIFCCFLCLVPLLPKCCTYWMTPVKMYHFTMVGILCNDNMSERSKIWLIIWHNISHNLILAGWHLQERDISFFSFSCSGFGLTLIKKCHKLNCYAFLQKFLLKTKLAKSFLVIVVAQFTAKAINSENVIYFLSFKSCSINKASNVIHM